MDLIARTITTPRGISRLSFIVSGSTFVGVVAFGAPPVALFLVPMAAMIIRGHLEPWAERRLGRRY
jgi:hypothetical protein